MKAIWNPGWAWLVLVVIIVVYVVIFDVHAAISGGETMSGRARDWVFDPVVGPFVVGAWAAVFIGLTWHFFTRNVGNK